MPSYAITGASRGIGYALLKELSSDPANIVIGIVRSLAPFQKRILEEFPSRKNIHAVHGDLSDFASLKAAAATVGAITGDKLDVLIANAAIVDVDVDPIDKPDRDWLKYDKLILDSIRVNVLGNIHLMSLFTPLIQQGDLKKVVAVSTPLGDVDFTVEVNSRFQTPYSISKAALNLAVAKFHTQYHGEGILFMAVSPGLVDTGVLDQLDLTSPDGQAGLQEMMAGLKAYAPHTSGPSTPEESASQVLAVVDKATIRENAGVMVSHLGTKRWL